MTIESLLKEFDEKFSFIKSYWEGPSDKDYDDLKSFLREKTRAMLEEIEETLKKERMDSGEEWGQGYDTLEELIEACGDKFEGLIPNKGPLADSDTNWSAAGAGQIGLGSSPKIAVARLWLALNKK